jgi:hypothetical protein
MSEQTARDATAQLLNVVAGLAPATDVQQLVARMPGAAELLKSVQPVPPPPAPAAAEVLGGLGDLVSSALSAAQGAVGDGVVIANALHSVGLDPAKAATFLMLFVDFARKRAGAELVDRVIFAVPVLKQFVP